MIDWLLTAPVLLPVLVAGLSLTVWRSPGAQRLLGVGALTAVLVDAVALLFLTDRRGPLVLDVGDWPAPAGITVVADRLSALLLTVALAVALAVLVFAVGQGSAEGRGTVQAPFHPSYLLLAAGVSLAFLAGDLFNLFVAFELMLAASYVLINLDADENRIRAGMTYTITSLLSSLLFLTAVGLIYGATGTVNLADLGNRVPDLPEGLRTVFSLLLLIVFGIKAAMVPLHFWLPDSYPTAPAPITAVLAALLTKVGLYAMVRTQTLLFPRTEPWTPLLVAAAVTLLVGVLGAVAQQDLNRLLSFVLVGHIGYMLFGLSLYSVTGLAGTVLYAVHHIAVQAALFLIAGLVVGWSGSAKLPRLARAAPPPGWLAGVFLIAALSLSGIPPLSGFVAKLVLLQAGAEQGGAAAFTLLAAALLTSLLTLYAMARVWRAVFATGSGRPPAVRPRGAGVRLMVGATVGSVLIGVLVAVGAGPVARVGERAARDLIERDAYQEAVLGPRSEDGAGAGNGTADVGTDADREEQENR
ncbi:Na+/H+ antiporter subunit D [Streptomyces sp. TRM43335]|uniref:Na+/H+ antiporter subunit D n=1 Tax=Streptomyces taklimakanensis TaxID=2569853 RepID=A0A6G2BI38_9ACTN|nr:Na+/H+ antiporter subunit D [Streptomyces taklimakanensis]MTE21786.1 Na+/H+ antiporter subunit D [Streptomyces taklimakanensis]